MRNVPTLRNREKIDDTYSLLHYIPPAIKIAYLCRARLSEILSLNDHHVRKDGLYLERVKKSRSQVIAWSPRLQAAVNAMKKQEGVSFQRHLFHNRQGQKINDSTFKSAWQGLMKRAQEKGAWRTFYIS